MSNYANIKRCLELSDRDIASAVGDRRLVKALLDQLAKVSRPGDGAPKLLLVFARMAGASSEWIDGALRVEMVGDADVTVVEVLSELGLGMHERVFPSFKMSVPLEEFVRAVERVPHMIAPLTVAATSERRLVLTVPEEDDEAGNAVPQPAVSIGADSLYTGERRRTSKDKLAAVKDPGTRILPRTKSTDKQRASRKSSRPHHAAAPPAVPSASPPRTSPPTVVPRAPPLPRTDERTPEPGPAPGAKRAIVARVPLTKVQVARGSRPVTSAPARPSTPARASRPPKRPSLRPAATKASTPSKPPGRGSKAPPAKSVAPKSIRPRPAVSEPPDEEKIDGGWEDD